MFDSVENDEHDRCVDFFSRPNGSFGFEEFRRDVEDQGRWTPVQAYSGMVYAAATDVRQAALQAVRWLTIAGPVEPSISRMPTAWTWRLQRSTQAAKGTQNASRPGPVLAGESRCRLQ